MSAEVIVISGPEIAAYGFPGGHPFGPDRHDAFASELAQSASRASVELVAPRRATREDIEYFPRPGYGGRVVELSGRGTGYLAHGDTPAFPGVFEAAANVVGGTRRALADVVQNPGRPAFMPIGGLHHAAR